MVFYKSSSSPCAPRPSSIGGGGDAKGITGVGLQTHDSGTASRDENIMVFDSDSGSFGDIRL